MSDGPDMREAVQMVLHDGLARPLLNVTGRSYAAGFRAAVLVGPRTSHEPAVKDLKTHVGRVGLEPTTGRL